MNKKTRIIFSHVFLSHSIFLQYKLGELEVNVFPRQSLVNSREGIQLKRQKSSES